MSLRSLWKKTYTLRRYAGQEIFDGYPIATYSTMRVSLDVQPDMNASSTDKDGKRKVQRLTSYGNDPIYTDNVELGTRADRLFFDGDWFECDSVMMYEHTPISHYTATWVRIPEGVVK